MSRSLDRRRFVEKLSAVLLASTSGVLAQCAPHVYRLGILFLGGSVGGGANLEAIRERLRDHGYVEGRNLVIEARYAQGRGARLPELVAELIALNPDVIVTIGTPAAIAAKHATDRIPIVMSGVADPVGQGLVTSLSRPGGNVTGVTNNTGSDFFAKQLQLLKEAAPSIARVAVLMTNHPVELGFFDTMRAAGPALGLTPIRFTFEGTGDIDLAALTRLHPDALYVLPNSDNVRNYKGIVAHAAANRLPAMYCDREPVEQGGLMSYWTDWISLRQRAADYVYEIFKGKRPSDLPVEDPTKFELVINLKTASTLGLAIPQSLLQRADVVIQQ